MIRIRIATLLIHARKRNGTWFWRYFVMSHWCYFSLMLTSTKSIKISSFWDKRHCLAFIWLDLYLNDLDLGNALNVLLCITTCLCSLLGSFILACTLDYVLYYLFKSVFPIMNIDRKVQQFTTERQQLTAKYPFVCSFLPSFLYLFIYLFIYFSPSNFIYLFFLFLFALTTILTLFRFKSEGNS